MGLVDYAKQELDILVKTFEKETEDDSLIVEEFIPEILSLVQKFADSGQSGGSAPFTLGVIVDTIKKVMMYQPLTAITGEDWEWVKPTDDFLQNTRCFSLFKDNKHKQAHYLDAIVWKGGAEYDTFTGTVDGITSRQFVKSFPFTPKTFYIDVVKGNDDEYHIKDIVQLDAVFEYYDMFEKHI